MSKIAVIVSNPCISDARVIKISEAAAEMGHDVHVFATKGQNSLQFEKKNNITYHRLEWNLSKLVRDMLFMKVLFFLNKKVAIFILKRVAPFFKFYFFKKIFVTTIEKFQPDLVHAHDLITLPLGFHVAKKCNSKIIYDAHELEVHRNPPLPFLQKKQVSYIEKKYGQKADEVIMVCEAAGKILEKHLNRNDIPIIFNSPIVQEYNRTIRDDLDIDLDRPLILYVGKVVVEGRGVDDTIKLLSSLPNFHFATVGPCDVRVKSKLLDLAKKENVLDRFTILPPVDFRYVVNYIKGADIGTIVISTKTLSYRLTMPNKLQEMTFANIPILAKEGLSEVKKYMDKFENGEIVDFEHPERLSYIFSKFYNERKKYKLDDNKKKLLEKEYSWDTQKEKIFTIYDRLLS